MTNKEVSMRLTVWTALLVAAVAPIAAAPMASGQALEPVATTEAGANLNLQPPTVQTGDVVVLGPSTARLTGTVDTNNLDTSVFFEYGAGEVLSLRTPTVNVAAGLNPTQVVADLVDLKPGTGYSYRLVAESAAGQSTGEPGTFVPGESSPPQQGQESSSPAVTVSRQTGRASASGKGARCTIVGTAGNDVLKGTSRADVICGLAGNDRLSGRGGNDVLLGGDGKDRVSGGSGRDVLYGNGGRDHLAGNKGKDRVYGNVGNDRIILSGDRRRGDRANGGRGRDRASVNRGDRVRSVELVSRR
jgi:Ca2+-binding RTX toxin-like protein